MIGRWIGGSNMFHGVYVRPHSYWGCDKMYDVVKSDLRHFAYTKYQLAKTQVLSTDLRHIGAASVGHAFDCLAGPFDNNCNTKIPKAWSESAMRGIDGLVGKWVHWSVV